MLLSMFALLLMKLREAHRRAQLPLRICRWVILMDSSKQPSAFRTLATTELQTRKPCYRRYLLKNSRVRVHASFAAVSS